MKYKVTIKPKPVTIEVETLSGPDVAEEWARQIFYSRICDGRLPVHYADYSEVEVSES
jgi:hypothetical protein